MRKKARLTVLACVTLAVCLVACGGGAKASDDGYGVGDPVEVGDVVITLDSASLISYRAKATFTMENRGSADLVLDPAATFAIKGENTGTDVPLEPDPNCPGRLTGAVPAGGSASGQVCWRSDPSQTWPIVVTITYSGGEAESGPAVWTVKSQQ